VEVHLDPENSLTVRAVALEKSAKVPQIGIPRFAKLCIATALETSWDKADWFTGLAGFTLGAVAYFIPSWEAAVTHSLLIIPLAAFASVAVVRLMMSPLLVCRKRDNEARIAEEQAADAEKRTYDGRPILVLEVSTCLKQRGQVVWTQHSRTSE
jgi:hypothetical protein